MYLITLNLEHIHYMLKQKDLYLKNILSLLIIKDNFIVKNIEYNISLLIYNYIKNKYVKIDFIIGRINQLKLKYKDIRKIFNKIKNDNIMKNISQYEYIKNNDDILILINDSSDDDI